jgi:hypothetical protein
MSYSTFLLGMSLFVSVLSTPLQATPKRKIPCKTLENAKACYWTHGRLGAGNGTPAFRLWKVGTDRLLGVYSGPSIDWRYSLDNENPERPANLLLKFKPLENRAYGDFEVGPLEPEKSGHMQAACVESAKNIVTEE